MSNDIDIVYTHPTADTRGLLEKLVRRLTEKGTIRFDFLNRIGPFS
jgi:hypothetical protein